MKLVNSSEKNGYLCKSEESGGDKRWLVSDGRREKIHSVNTKHTTKDEMWVYIDVYIDAPSSLLLSSSWKHSGTVGRQAELKTTQRTSLRPISQHGYAPDRTSPAQYTASPPGKRKEKTSQPPILLQ